MHDLRARVGAIIVGTGTVLADDPAADRARGAGGDRPRRPCAWSSGRGRSPQGAQVLDDAAPTLVTAERDPRALLADLYERGVRHALLEGGPTLAAAFLARRRRRPRRVVRRPGPPRRRAGRAPGACPRRRRAGSRRDRASTSSGRMCGSSVACGTRRREPRCSPESWRSSDRSRRSPISATPPAWRSAVPRSRPTRDPGDSISVNGVCLTVVDAAGRARSRPTSCRRPSAAARWAPSTPARP